VHLHSLYMDKKSLLWYKKSLYFVYGSIISKEVTVKYLFIPSCEVAPKNRLTGTTTLKRLVYGLSLWRGSRYDFIIVSGGVYLPPHTQTIASGKLMKEWLVDQGVSAERILSEEEARDTYENISGSLELIKDSTPDITVVSHWQHAIRFWITFRLAHQLRARIVPMWYWVDLKVFVLEWIILLVHLMDPKGTGRIATGNRKARTYLKGRSS
jgi:hypothetical protein